MFPGNNSCVFMVVILVGMVLLAEGIIGVKKNQLRNYEKKYEVLCTQIEKMNQQEIGGSGSS